jgi:hypothetical protein
MEIESERDSKIIWRMINFDLKYEQFHSETATCGLG